MKLSKEDLQRLRRICEGKEDGLTYEKDIGKYDVLAILDLVERQRALIERANGFVTYVGVVVGRLDVYKKVDQWLKDASGGVKG